MCHFAAAAGFRKQDIVNLFRRTTGMLTLGMPMPNSIRPQVLTNLSLNAVEALAGRV